ncbi:MAG: beta-carboxysome assembly chaperone CcmS [Spirulinaceae cyanobacterium]
MFSSSSPQPASAAAEVWKARIDQFTQAHQQELAALAWGIYQQDPDTTDTIGIDLKPEPHFVTCKREALDRLNQNVGGHLQELLGIRDNADLNNEVVMIVIGEGQLKLIYFAMEPSPAVCFEQVGQSVEALMTQLEADLQQRFAKA